MWLYFGGGIIRVLIWGAHIDVLSKYSTVGCIFIKQNKHYSKELVFSVIQGK